MQYYLGIDLGGTKTIVGLFDLEDILLHKFKMVTDPKLSYKDMLAKITEMTISLLKERKFTAKDVSALGIAAPGLIDSKRGVIRFSANLPGWIDVPLKEILEKDLGVKTIVDHDVRTMVLGERYHGAGLGKDNFVCITLGTGIGLGAFIHGRPYAGAEMKAGEFGHVTMVKDGPLCGCGNRGCLEVMAAGPAPDFRTLGKN